MKNSEKILRNWKIIWTVGAVLLSLTVVYIGLTVDIFSVLGSDTGIKIICNERNNIDNIMSCEISSSSAAGLFFNIFTSFFSFGVIQLLHIPIWGCRKELIT